VPVLAEGVETTSQLATVIKEGCDEVQGYLIGRPQPIKAYASIVAAGSIVDAKARRSL
jgi:EAL domain-containing protein (putative c-di-GMP-specific phosphodiesterase class I)